MGEKIGAGLIIAAIFATLTALVMFPPAGIVVGAAFVWWMIQTSKKGDQEIQDRLERERQEYERRQNRR